jgi:hypothetical protein
MPGAICVNDHNPDPALLRFKDSLGCVPTHLPSGETAWVIKPK